MRYQDNARRIRMIVKNFDKIEGVLFNGGVRPFPMRQLELALEFCGEDWRELEHDLYPAVHALEETKIGHKYFEKLAEYNGVAAKLRYVNENVTQADLAEEGAKCLLQVYEILIAAFNHYNEQLMDLYYTEWWDNLYKPGGVGDYFIVHFFNTVKRAGVLPVSCSLISEKCCETYRNYGYGFMYLPRRTELIGMCPNDAGTVCMARSGWVDSGEELASLLVNEVRFDLHGFAIYGLTHDLLSVYPLEEFEHRTKNYSEILLNGDAVPEAIFTFKDAFEAERKRLLAMCYAMHLPLVIYDGKKAICRSWCEVKGELYFE